MTGRTRSSVHRHTLGAIAICLTLSSHDAEGQRTDPRQQVDRLFSMYTRKNSPGCALAVIRDGRIVYEKGYGMANVEYAVPIGPGTIFHIASVSKQFTAFAIQLLVADGRLSLDDDVRKYLPELHDFGATITIRHLLHHTSGLRDQWTLLNMAGWRSGDIITEDDILGLVWRQTALNFAPGEEELYSNTGYTLLGLIVQRVSGQTLRQFSEERIFGPLGMTRTHFNDDNTEVIAGRAYSYNPRDAGRVSNAPLQYANVGATNLLTTVEDMARWDRNFDDGKVGGTRVLEAMLQPGTLSSDKTIDYASGLSLGEYRGVKTIAHSGSDAGFRSEYLRFPDQRFSVVLLSNLSSVDVDGLARQVADIYLADQLGPRRKAQTLAAPQEIHVDPNLYDNYVGDYLLGPDLVFTFSRDRDQLLLTATGRGKMQVFPLSATEFFFKGIGARFHFVVGQDGRANKVILNDGGVEMPGPRFTRVLPGPDELAEYAGDYYSRELGAVYVVAQRDSGLALRYPRGVIPLQPIQQDTYVAGYPIGNVQFVRDAASGVIRGFKLTSGRVRNVSFERIHLPGVSY
jgi:CubicO group peptidase (beta-lactamase class C family)